MATRTFVSSGRDEQDYHYYRYYCLDELSMSIHYYCAIIMIDFLFFFGSLGVVVLMVTFLHLIITVFFDYLTW